MANEYRYAGLGLVFLDENFDLSECLSSEEVLVTTSNGEKWWVEAGKLEKLRLPHSNPLVLAKEATQENSELLKEILAELKALRKEIRS